MVFNKFLDYITTIAPLDIKDIDQLLPFLVFKKVKRKEYLLLENQPSHVCFFVLKGSLRSVANMDNGSEITINFSFENQWCSDYSSFISGKPSVYRIQAIEDCELVCLTKADIEKLYTLISVGNQVGRIVFERLCQDFSYRLFSLRTKDIVERYELLGEWFPGIYNRVPQHMIASYLGISRVHLSRIKSTMKRKLAESIK